MGMQNGPNIREHRIQHRMQQRLCRGTALTLHRLALKIDNHDIARPQLTFMAAGYRNGNMFLIYTGRVVAACSRGPATPVQEAPGIHYGFGNNSVSAYIKHGFTFQKMKSMAREIGRASCRERV